MEDDLKQQIRDIADKIAQEYKPEKIILFGSHAWGKPSENSDVDLFVVKDTSDRRIDRSREVNNIVEDADFPMDILVYTPKEVDYELWLEDFFVQRIIEKGKVLYEKKREGAVTV